jgi:hypothetical protein
MMGKKLGVKDYRDAKVQAAFSDAEAARAIKEVVKSSGKETMKPFGSKLSEADIKALVAYVRSFKKYSRQILQEVFSGAAVFRRYRTAHSMSILFPRSTIPQLFRGDFSSRL